MAIYTNKRLTNNTIDEASILSYDPLVEVANIIAESENTFNKIMKSCLNSNIRSLTEGNIKNFFSNIAEWFKRLFEAIQRSITEVLRALNLKSKMDKSFLANQDNMKKIKDGFDKDWKVSGCAAVFNNRRVYYDAEDTILNHYEVKTPDEISNDDLIRSIQSDTWKEDIINDTAVAMGVTLKEAKTLDAYKKALIDKYIGEDVEITSKNISMYDVIDIIQDDKEAYTIKTLQKEMQQSYREAIKTIDKCKEMANSKYSNGDLENLMDNLKISVNTQKLYKQIDSVTISVILRIAKIRLEMSRRLIYKWAKLGGVDVSEISEPKEKEKEEVNENAGIFGTVSFI